MHPSPLSSPFDAIARSDTSAIRSALSEEPTLRDSVDEVRDRVGAALGLLDAAHGAVAVHDPPIPARSVRLDAVACLTAPSIAPLFAATSRAKPPRHLCSTASPAETYPPAPQDGRTPLLFAAYEGILPALLLLVELGGDIAATDLVRGAASARLVAERESAHVVPGVPG